MITLLSAPLPIALSLADPSLPELVTLALVLLITLAMALILAAAVLAQTWAPTRLAHSLKHILVATVDSRLARKQQNLTTAGTVNCRLCFPLWTETKQIEQATGQAIPNKEPASPVLVFPGCYVRSQTKPPFPILNHKQLVKTLSTVRTQIHNQQQVDAIVYQVAQRCLSKNEVGK
jgi:hypothetical protein